MKKADGVGPPRDVMIQKQRGNYEQATDVVYEEWLLADGVSAINDPLDRHIIDVVDPGQEEKDPCEMISP